MADVTVVDFQLPKCKDQGVRFCVASTYYDGTSAKVWCSLEDFKLLHDELVKTGTLHEADEINLVESRRFHLPFTAKTWTNRAPFASDSAFTDLTELQRLYLDNYMKSLVSISRVRIASSLQAFLKLPYREDWPSALGPIDLRKHDLPHDTSYTEWWYYNTHFTDIEGNEYSAFVCFFRTLKFLNEKTGEKRFAHALVFSLTDVQKRKYHQHVLVDKDTPKIMKKQLEDDRVIRDPRLRLAYLEILERGNVPKPDKMFTEEVVCDDKEFNLQFESGSVRKDSKGRYIVKAATEDGKTWINFACDPQKPAVRHGQNGIVKGHDGDDMFYYLIPRCALSGSFGVEGVAHNVSSGTGWYDHEFGGYRDEESVPMKNYAWNWAAIQLNNDYDMSLAVLVDPSNDSHTIMETSAIIIDPEGVRTESSDLVFEGRKWWTSIRSFNEYPTEWTVRMKSHDIYLTLTATFPDQEFVTLLSKPAFWEGRIEVEGTMRGVPVTGLGYIERNGFSPLSDLSSFFSAVGKKTREEVRKVYPDDPNFEQTLRLVGSEVTKHYIHGVPYDKIYDGLIAPVRYITDRGGKSWRSYGALACMNIVGGDARNFITWLAMPEFMHVGSLIIDDIQDQSTLRRGTESCHLRFGKSVAINSGTAAYFQAQQMLNLDRLAENELNQVYDLYFAALRGGHAGQALDITGVGYMMDDCIEQGDNAFLEKRVLAIHRLKTAVPAGSLARMGALVGGGTKQQVEAIGKYFESIGLAFQIMDDVLNLRGLMTGESDKVKDVQLKNLGEDVTAGKVTMPVVKAVGKLPRERMQELWRTIESKPEDAETIARCIDTLENCGAIDACVDQAIDLVESAWAELDPLVEDSFSKIMLRSFGWFVTERTY